MDGEPVLKFKDFCKSFFNINGREKRILNGVNLEIFPGDLVALVGKTGRGKSQLMESILPPAIYGREGVVTGGYVRLFGERLDEVTEKRHQELMLLAGYIFQEGALFSLEGGTVYDNIALWFREHTKMKAREIAEIVRYRLEQVGLDPDEVWNLKPAELSGGMYKKVAVARTVAYRPRLLVCDEPTRGADPDGTFVVTDMLRDFHEKGGKELKEYGGRATIIITHDRESTQRLNCPIMLLTKAGNVKRFPDFDSFWKSREEEVNDYWGDYREKCSSSGYAQAN